MQEINLYESLSKSSPFAITAKRTKTILGRWILLLICIFIVQSIYATYQYSRYSVFLDKEKKINERIKALIQSSPKIQQVRELEKTITTVSKKIENQMNFIQEMTRYHAQDIKFKPADYLNELANTSTSKVWITSINLQNQGQQIDLAGFTLSTSQLTQFVTRLQDKPHFNKKPFANVAITPTTDSEKMAFILSTKDQKNE